jgi:site-specific DNA recombinase
VADKLVWEKIAYLMSSEELLSEQVGRWFGAREAKANSSSDDTAIMEKDVATLKVQEDRYNKAYGAGVFTVEQLSEYTSPLRAKIASLKSQIASAQQEANAVRFDEIPSEDEIREYSEAARKVLHDLNFQARRAILVKTVERIVGTQQRLQIYGHIPIKNHVAGIPI